jgi:Zn-dependent peptidase ImmA (M78 family)/transcriptional regulator with XRE-family HTH domain
MGKRVVALVTPAVLKWARENDGYTPEFVAKKLKVTAADVVAWEAGQSRPSLTQLRKLATLYRRPTAVFYLPAPPQGFQTLRDFRRAPDSGRRRFSPELMYEMRRAQERRTIALELYEAAGETPSDFAVTASRNESPEDVGVRLRDALDVTYDEQISWRPGHGALNGWRAHAEGAGVLVFQSKGVGEDEMRGFSLSERPLPVVVLNGREQPPGRIFTLAHELTHIALRSAGVCDLLEDGTNGHSRARLAEPANDGEAREVERFCNASAAALLMPKEHLLAEPLVVSHRGVEWSDNTLLTLANKFGVSREAMLLRLLTLRRTTEEFYWEKRHAFLEQYRKRSKRKQEGGPEYHVAVVARAGRLFTRLVLDSYHEKRITAADASEYLSIGVPSLPKVETEVYRGGVAA